MIFIFIGIVFYGAGSASASEAAGIVLKGDRESMIQSHLLPHHWIAHINKRYKQSRKERTVHISERESMIQ